ncbi:MAG TPA: acyl-ACP--UDP-N-acetylglucosamine O-acyltransferase [Candidatus Sumerlaeota bacterium]|nr:MAG: Acyl-(acyl-carrier-protein)--UDP-N-acetylglucosamine O-acyltransferase [candidate division BRC1 bacterium ADurb.BinA292]HOE95405.1 acyl-ACP--UDP-N-acetylglucosamine O-acyltransferase [Candidatus Sumerlaeota bacterium]
MAQIHPTAVVDPSARLADDVTVGPYTIIEADVTVGAGSRIGAHVTLGERLRLGCRVRVFNYACLGTASQDLKHRGEISRAEIGDDCIIREFVTVNRGTREASVTRVGRGVALLAYSHVAHECVIEDGAILVNGATLGGEVHIGRRATLGGLVGIHQYCRVGDYAFVGANSKVTQDVPPFLLVDGHPARPFGPNVVGLQRNGFSEEQIREIHRLYQIVFDRSRGLNDNLAYIREKHGASPIARTILEFCRDGSRGIVRPRQRRRMAMIPGDLQFT